MGVKGLTRYGQYPLSEILPHIGKLHYLCKYSTGQSQVRMRSERMKLIARQQDCQCCGLKGQFFALELGGCFSPHFNLYGINQQGHEVLLTADHIKPRCKGGKSKSDNLQLLCCHCNSKKGSEEISLEDLRKKQENKLVGIQRKAHFVERKDKLTCSLLSPLAVIIVGLNISYHDFSLYHFMGYSAFIARNKESDLYEMAIVTGLTNNLHDFLWIVIGNSQIEKIMRNYCQSVNHALGLLISYGKSMRKIICDE